MKENIQALAKVYHAEVVQIRRHLHQYPELSFHEKETSLFIARQLESYGIEHQTGVADNGIVALLKGRNPDRKTVALRADMDALPILEANDVPYKSRNTGVMHACGHDAHTASLLGTARILDDLKDDWEGTVKLIFQPAEEKLPGGASLMIKAGVLENPAPMQILGQHVHPPLEVGKIGIRSGMYMASADEIYVTIHGKGGHGALPQDCIDPVAITAQLITALQQVVSRQLDPTIPALLTFGKMTANGATNVIPNQVMLEGTFRCMDEKWRSIAHDRMLRMATGLVESMGGRCEFNIVKGYPCLYNNELVTEAVRRAAREYLGEENVVDLPLRMTAEDFAYYSQEIPAAFYRLGTRNPAKGITSPIHTDTFDIDEEALLHSTGLMAWLAINALI